MAYGKKILRYRRPPTVRLEGRERMVKRTLLKVPSASDCPPWDERKINEDVCHSRYRRSPTVRLKWGGTLEVAYCWKIFKVPSASDCLPWGKRKNSERGCYLRYRRSPTVRLKWEKTKSDLLLKDPQGTVGLRRSALRGEKESWEK